MFSRNLILAVSSIFGEKYFLSENRKQVESVVYIVELVVLGLELSSSAHLIMDSPLMELTSP